MLRASDFILRSMEANEELKTRKEDQLSGALERSLSLKGGEAIRGKSSG